MALRGALALRNELAMGAVVPSAVPFEVLARLQREVRALRAAATALAALGAPALQVLDASGALVRDVLSGAK